ncbi:MAG: carbohydrate ABC transporter permease [Chloroflexi bacterium]|nr:carbohydrate ABC transporter permease [Chloroflexota bacterium]
MQSIAASFTHYYRAFIRHASRHIKRAITYLILSIGGAVILLPFFWMISSSLKKQWDVYHFPPVWIPNPPQWQNYVDALTVYPFHLYLLNTSTIVVLTCLGTVLSCSLAGYGFSRLRAPGRDVIFVLLLSTMMLPYTVTMIPLFMLFNKLRWVDTFRPLIVPAFFGNAFSVFLLRQFFLTIPRELEDAARIDGCSSLMIYWRIVLPLSTPALATVAIFQFMGSWNDFLGPLIYLSDEGHRTVALALAYFQGSARVGPQMHLMMAVAFVALIPPLLLYFFAQRLFIQGIVFTGVKG